MDRLALVKIIFPVAAIGFFGLLIIWGLNSGRAKAESRFLVFLAEQARIGLKYYYSDNERFPTAGEFISGKALGLYFDHFPFDYPKSQICPENFIYQRPTPGTYKLSVCLPTNFKNFNEGWNTFPPL